MIQHVLFIYTQNPYKQKSIWLQGYPHITFLINILFSRQSYFEKKDKIIIAIKVPSCAYYFMTGCDFHCRTFLKFIKTLEILLASCIPNKNEFAHFYKQLKLESDF